MMNPQIDFSPSISPRILIVDDDQKFLAGMNRTLSAAGFACEGCMTIEAAIAAVEARPPDLILTALHVQGVPGMEISRYVRENCDRADLPVMFLSATQMPDIIRRRDNGHGVYYLRRLLKGNVLLELIENVLPASVALSPA